MASHRGAPSNRRNYHQVQGAIKTSPENFADEVVNLIKAYTDEVVDAIVDETQETANVGMRLLQETTQPSMTLPGTAKPMTRRQWKKYSKSWAVEDRSGNSFYHATIRNKRHYRLTHLLEYGHATRNGGRTRAFEHIKPVEELCETRLLKNIPKIIEKGGKL